MIRNLLSLSLLSFSLAAHGAVSGVPQSRTLGNGFLFIGDSLTADEGNFGVDAPSTWPSILLRTPNYANCRTYFNGAIGGTTAQQWNATSNYFSQAYGSDFVNTLSVVNSPVPVGSLAPTVKGRDMLFIPLGYNDVGARTVPQLTNDLWTLWNRARSSNFLVVASTIPTNSGMSGATMQNLTNVNGWILTQSVVSWDWCMRPDLVLTNANLLAADNLHPNTNGATALANWVSTNIVPPLSGLLGFRDSPEREFKRLSVTNQADFVGFRISPDNGYVPNWGHGNGVEFAGLTIQSISRPSNAWRPLSTRADTQWLFGNSGVIVVSRFNFADQPSTTNDFYVHGTMGVAQGIVSDAGPGVYFVTNNTAADGSLLLINTGNGRMWFRTNGVWVVK